MKGKILFIVILVFLVLAGIIVAINLKQTKENSLEEILAKGNLILGLDDSFPPMGFRNEDNEIVGFDIDVAKEVCKRLNIELKIQPISWDAKEQELNSYNIDCIWNGMSVTEERAKTMSLSSAYLKNNMTFVVKDQSSIKKLEDLKGKTVGIQAGSSAEELLEESEIYDDLKEVITYSENLTAFMDLEINQIDAVFLDDIVSNYYIATNNKNYKVLDEGLESEEYAIGFRKQDTALRDEVNNILSEMKADGTLGKISTKWFGKDITIIEAK